MKLRGNPNPSRLAIVLRGIRQGFYYSEEHEGYIRMRWLDEEKSLFEVELCPKNYSELARLAPVGQMRPTIHIQWKVPDDPEGNREILYSLKLPEKISAYQKFKFNLEGEIV